MAELTITSPRDGDYLNRHDGEVVGAELRVPVTGTCPAGAAVTVNGVPATVTGETFSGTAALTDQNWTIEALSGDQSCEIAVLADRHSRKRYRYSIDDNIEFLRDLGQDPDHFASLFDHWYLAFWKLMNDRYGTKVHINTYYETEDQSWNTSLLPDKWRDEWEANADWLHLSFHARQNLPNRIYQHADYDRMAEDYELVVGEIKRYAGEAVLSRETTVHWAEAPLDACRALKDRGIDILIGLFWVRDGQCTTKYYLDIDQAAYCHTRDAWQDSREGLTFVSCDAVVNGLALDRVIPTLQEQAAGPHTGELLELLIHEQYFCQNRYYPTTESGTVRYFQPDIFQKVEDGIRWVTEQGYEPCFWSEGLLGSRGG
jgi:hypothetical protein